MSLRRIYNEVKGMKVKELPNYLKPMLSMNYVKQTVQRGLDNYQAKYIQTSSFDPVYHVCIGGMIFSYLVALPEERRHLEHQQHAKEHGHWSGLVYFLIMSSGLLILTGSCLLAFWFNWVIVVSEFAYGVSVNVPRLAVNWMLCLIWFADFY